MSAVLIELSEWAKIDSRRDTRLQNQNLVNDVRSLAAIDALAGRVEISAKFNGIKISTRSYVGSVDVGSLRIRILPKLRGVPLMRLVRYAYGLRDLQTHDKTVTPVSVLGFQDLLVSLLADEVQALLANGLRTRYVQVDQPLVRPRGRILVDKLASGGSTRTALPCRHFEQDEDWQVNQVLKAGLELAIRICGDRDLCRRIHALLAKFESVTHIGTLTSRDIVQASDSLTRITSVSAPALTLVALIHEMLGVELEPGRRTSAAPGFLFDMNKFFQRLLSRFLREHLMDATVRDELEIRSIYSYLPGANPKDRKPPRPRPDFALLRQDQLIAFLDAKYCDMWERRPSTSLLYQLSVYAMASPARISVMLYPTMIESASDEIVEVRPPFANGGAPAFVIVRPVLLEKLSTLVTDQSAAAKMERHRFAKRLVSLDTRQPLTNPR